MIIFKHAWILFIAIQCINGLVWWVKAQPKIKNDPTLLPGYKNLIKGWLIYGNIPWLIMGAGILSGSVENVPSYFNPKNGAFVILFYASIVVLWIASIYWVFFKNGVEKLMRHPGILSPKIKSPIVIKAYFILAILGGIAGLSVMIFGNIPTLSFKEFKMK